MRWAPVQANAASGLIGQGSAPGLGLLDWLVLGAYGLGMLAIGWYYSRRTGSKDDYLLGGRSMRSSSIGLSLFATLFSTITYLALPGEMINKGPGILCWMVGVPLVYLVVGYLLIPPIMKLTVTSGYEILETRLGLGIRLLGSTIFLLTRLLWMALIIHITASKIIVVMMRWPESRTPYAAAAIGLVTLIYTSMGGIRAVVLTDVIQSFILLAGAILAIVLVTVRMGGLSWWPTQWSPSWDTQPLVSLDPTVRVTLLGSLVFMTLWWICTAGSDQMAIQRYLATRDARAARRAFLTTVISNVVITLVLASLGFAMLGFFRANPQALGPGMSIEKDADQLFPYYIVHFLPRGAVGLVIAALLAAAMSSLSSGMNSSCSVISADFISRWWRNQPDRLTPGPRGPHRSALQEVTEAKIIAVISGLVAIALSLLMSKISNKINILETTVRTNHVFVAPLFGLFFMAMFVRFATPLGAACGALAGCAVAILIASWGLVTDRPPLSFQWITLVSLLVHLGVGCSVSLATGNGRGRSAGPPQTGHCG